ncbi:MAG: ankyrin repeat domain-containing protein [Hyphomonadaceae bacterium]|nr:ankyrin repeat domain-containing protein [Hyphomonadaceae bacterium]
MTLLCVGYCTLDSGRTSLHRAAAYGTTETVATLIKARANPRATNKSEKLATDLARGNYSVRRHHIYRVLDAVR